MRCCRWNSHAVLKALLLGGRELLLELALGRGTTLGLVLVLWCALSGLLCTESRGVWAGTINPNFHSQGTNVYAVSPLSDAPLPAPDILVQPLSQTIDENDEVWFTVVATNNLPLTYQWQFNATNLPGATQPVLYLREVPLTGAGDYRVVVSSPYLSTTSTVAVLTVTPVPVVAGPGYVSQKDQASLKVALAQTNYIRFGVSGYLTLTNTLLITNHTTLDGTGRKLTLDGANLVRHCLVSNGATLRLINLRLSNGRFVATQGQTSQDGAAGLGGSIYVANGALELVECRFMSNQVVGGLGGPPGPLSSYGGSGGPAYGGAVCLTEGQLLATNCLFADNSSIGGQGSSSDFGYSAGGGESFGGALYCTNGVLTLCGVTLTNNLAQGGSIGGGRAGGQGGGAHGGAIAGVETPMRIGDCVLASNLTTSATKWFYDLAISFPSAEGGALYHNGGSSSIHRSWFTGNQALGGSGGSWRSAYPPMGGDALGGAIFNQAGDLTLQNSALTSNGTQGGVAGGWIGEVGQQGGTAYGGAIANRSALFLVNCTLTENQAEPGDTYSRWSSIPQNKGVAFGGAIYSAGPLSLLNVTIAGNTVEEGHGFPPASYGSSIDVTNAAATIINTILSCAAGQTNVAGNISDGGHNLCSDGSAEFTSPTSRTSVEPMLGPLADNSGPTPTMALLPGSPAIDAGDDSAAPDTDQRGVGRPCGRQNDIGAFELAIPEPLRITKAPEPLTLLVGETDSFLVAVNGLASYQWRKDGTNVLGATHSTLFLSDLQLSEAGDYQVIASTSSGAVTSAPVRLTVLRPAPPVIVRQPDNQTAAEGLAASFSVTATNLLALRYQWQHNGTNIPGAIQPLLTLGQTRLEDAGSYVALVSTKYLSTASQGAILTVLPNAYPWILSQPTNQSVIEGGATTFIVVPRGAEPLSYEWRFEGVALDGATSPTLTLTNISVTQAGAYTVSISNALGGVLSSEANLSVTPNVLDLTFVPPPALTNCTQLYPQEDGRVLVATWPDNAVLRLQVNGSLDPSYVWPFPDDYSTLVGLEPDGGILAWVTHNTQYGPWLFLTRLSAAGQNTGGVTNDWILPYQPMVLAPDGTIYVGTGGPPGQLERAAPNGTKDPTFRVAFPEGQLNNVWFQPDGKLLVQLYDTNRSQPVLLRIDGQGVRESGFAVTLDFGSLNSVAMEPDGGLIMGGAFSLVNDVTTRNLARLNADGSVDPSFRSSLPFQPLAMSLDDDERLYVGGWPGPGSSSGLIRVQNDGAIDPSFQADTGGGAVAAIINLGAGQLLMGGSFETINNVPRAGVARLLLASSVPRIANWTRIGPMVRFSVPTLENKSYSLERSDRLGLTGWVVVDTVLGNGSNRVLIDHSAPAGSAFYQVSMR
jgi:hypothetical protein